MKSEKSCTVFDIAYHDQKIRLLRNLFLYYIFLGSNFCLDDLTFFYCFALTIFTNHFWEEVSQLNAFMAFALMD